MKFKHSKVYDFAKNDDVTVYSNFYTNSRRKSNLYPVQSKSNWRDLSLKNPLSSISSTIEISTSSGHELMPIFASSNRSKGKPKLPLNVLKFTNNTVTVIGRFGRRKTVKFNIVTNAHS